MLSRSENFHNQYGIFLKIIIVVFLVIHIIGCATPPRITDAAVAVPGKSIVFGSVEVVEDGKPKEWKMTWTGLQEFKLLIIASDDPQAVIYKLAADGSFAWALAPGDYTIAGYELSKGTSVRSGRIWAEFSVPQDAESVYIGDLKLLMDKGIYSFGIADSYTEAIEKYRTKFQSKSDQPVKALMALQGKLGTYERVKYVCAEEWGIECTDKFRGITPIFPDVTKGRFSEVGSLTPRLEWKPSASEGITYDLLIHEAVTYSRSGMDEQYMPGLIVVYEERLEAPAWQPDKPLKPGKKYLWSVRLRQDGTVSNWSRHSYFAFYVFAWSAGHGQWFSFSTP